MSETRDLLLQQRGRLLQRLIDLAVGHMDNNSAAVFRVKSQNILNELRNSDAALFSISEGPKQYARCARHIDAVLKCLQDTGCPMKEGDIIDAVISGGYREGDESNPFKLAKSIQIHLTGTGKSKNVIKKINDLVGLYEWDDDAFKR